MAFLAVAVLLMLIVDSAFATPDTSEPSGGGGKLSFEETCAAWLAGDIDQLPPYKAKGCMKWDEAGGR